MKIEKETEVKKVEKVTVGYQCDTCGKIMDIPKYLNERECIEVDVYEFGESVYLHFCSPECLAKHFSKYNNGQYADISTNGYDLGRISKKLIELLNK